ncbi:MAG: pantoate--beta-alanine ligase [Flavobacteriaceae bacterium]|nr:pantoate--beta-alanine ligase [Flavobacteriaceae bacterium]
MIFHHQSSLQSELQKNRVQNRTVGFVPTMGALHEGHLALVKKALSENQITVVSIFVNPTQFDNAGDLEKYPRTLKTDAQLLKKLDDKILVYAPNPGDLYGDNVVSKKYSFGGLEHQMEGEFRTGHFDGVGTVVNLLFRAVRPDKAYFGEKDFQQLQIIKKLVSIEKLPIEIIGCPIYREKHGLAMSSRNKRLSKVQFEEAKIICETLKWAQSNFSEKSIGELQKHVSQTFQQNPHLKLEYFEIANIDNLRPARRKRKGNTYRAFIAAYAGEVRLIDNMALN